MSAWGVQSKHMNSVKQSAVKYFLATGSELIQQTEEKFSACPSHNWFNHWLYRLGVVIYMSSILLGDELV